MIDPLDDYEEGVWAPVTRPSLLARLRARLVPRKPTVWTTSVGRYTKVGPVVWWGSITDVNVRDETSPTPMFEINGHRLMLVPGIRIGDK